MALRRTPAALVLAAVIVGVMAVGAVSPAAYGWLVRHAGVTAAALGRGQLWRVPASPLVQDRRGVVPAIVVLLPALVAAERRFGTAAAVGVFFVADAVSTVPVLVALAVLGPVWHAASVAERPNVGSSAGLLAVLAAWAVTRPPPARRVWFAVIAGGIAGAAAVDPDVAAVQHVVAVLVGAAAGRLLWARSAARAGGASSSAARAPAASGPGTATSSPAARSAGRR